MSKLEIVDLHVEVTNDENEKEEILKGVNLTVNTGEIHAIMGPNGTGKSTLSETIMGNPHYLVTKGDILIDGESLLPLSVDQRARKGVFLGMQYPAEVPGVTNAEFIRTAMNERDPEHKISIRDFIKKLDQTMNLLHISEEFEERNLNQGYSGGEKKRNEILQLMMLDPKFAILDEIDSGLDIDALKIVSKGVNSMRSDHFGALIITHYQRLLEYIEPDFVHVMMGGKVIKTGSASLAAELERVGYDGFEKEVS
ncbi:Fe-S cluster assembly ATPase SufC [Xylocopilactobacillus apicola]|uniref:ABC transporter ATP-binding protein n=1 Tax=Xylocopilactobacillus apicola TaxID=2932184 RepID=A0AAU9D7I6_9LACO|nr:Fe-S cluster assembly ATPase SufC [Xylocopilactobacillus apicola]BDR58280.1 ABC transporter ATP-binding protein [Xylocopilactobacillus apicola]